MSSYNDNGAIGKRERVDDNNEGGGVIMKKPTFDESLPNDDEELSRLMAFLDEAPPTHSSTAATIEVDHQEEGHLDIVTPDALRVPNVVELAGAASIEMPTISISNVVCKSSVGCSVDLDHCARSLKNVKRTTFPALFIQLKSVTLLLFSTGTVVGTGAGTFAENVISMTRLVKALHCINYPLAKLGKVEIENIIANFTMDFQVQIAKLRDHPHHRPYCETQDKFPCINYRIKTIEPQITLRLFDNGKCICQASKTLANVYEVTRLIVPVLYQFRQRITEPVDPTTLVSHL